MLQTILNNRYQIIQELGHGGFGTTYLAEDKQADDSLCAIKKLNSEKADIEIAQTLFKREADTLLQLQEVHQIPTREVMRDESDRVVLPESELIPIWLIDLLNKMVRTDFRERYQSVEEVLKDLTQQNRLKPIENIAANSLGITKSQIDNQPKRTNLSLGNYWKKLWYLPLIILPLLIITSEVINPWLRTRYYLRQGNNLLDNKQAQASLGKFQQAIALNRSYAAAWKGRGDALFTLRLYTGALEAYNKAIAIEPENIKALNNKGKILYQQGELPQAINTYQKAIALDSENAEAWSGIGLAYMTRQQLEKALESFEQAQKIKPDEPSFWLQKGIVLRALQRPQQATQFYPEAIAVYDESRHCF